MALSDVEQYLLELMNRARLDPLGEAARMGIDLNQGLAAGQISGASKQVLAPNAILESVAINHSLWMLNTDQFSHTGVNGTSPDQRIKAAGYSYQNCGENLALISTTAADTLQMQIETMNTNLFLSAGHRVNLMNGVYRELGVGSEQGVFTQAGTDFTANALSLEFGQTGTARFLTGVAYNDTNLNKFYSLGEGIANVVFSSGVKSASTAPAGGYGLSLGSLAVTPITGSAGALNFAVNVDMSIGNVKLDLVSGTTFHTSGSVSLVSGVNNVQLLGVNALNATGNNSANTLMGNSAANTLTGLMGVDVLLGYGGADKLIGGVGNDKLTGGAGADILTGSTGLDTFIFVNGHGNDRITDFSIASGDKLRLDDALWGGTVLKTSGIVAQFAKTAAGEVVMDFGGGDIIHLVGLSATTNLDAHIEVF
jgi:Ca2+-binding RTX toxin-like protein